ncbi:glycoside hydrolase family 28 protein [Chondrinema litorale]|uniref:glycoside hydrolase family 28 protein n=1 Tax=Chondrinema litorale TaxID=2994555 RepID=UPI002543D020|nr:glycosyl hydrolase family 28 protein [Chondrinema litorale]UZR98475.1 glycosyl hydrolase family 28 protein [Chondrinema litorale]
MHKIFFISLILSLLSITVYCNNSSSTVSTEINIVSLGAIGDGKTDNTQILQTAIDKVSVSGGGKVIVPEGQFVTGAFFLKDGVTIDIQYRGALLGSLDHKKYLDNEKMNHWINAENVNDIGIIGEGEVNGRGQELALILDSLYFAGSWDDRYNYRRHRPERRPKLLHFTLSKKIILEGVTFKNSANWVLDFDRCDQLTINRVTVDSDAYWNNDGMDIGDCTNVKITNCYVNSADDGICLKSHHPDVLNDNIYIANCVVRSSASAIKFGTASTGGFKNVKIENVSIYDTFRSAIALESVDGGSLENIEISGITAINTGNAIFIKLGHRNVNGEIGSLKNVSIKDVMVQIPYEVPDINYKIRGPELPFFHNVFPASISGLPDNYVENVTIENVRIIYPGRSNKGYAQVRLNQLSLIPEQRSDYPEFSMFGELPAWGFYVRHVKGLTFKNVTFELNDTDYRPAFVFDDVEGLKMHRIKLPDGSNSRSVILNDVVNFTHDLKDEMILQAPEQVVHKIK